MPYTAGNYASQFYQLSWGGNLPGGEQWTNGVKVVRAANDELDQYTDVALDTLLSGDLKSALETWFSASGTRITAWASINWVKMNACGVDGKYLHSITHRYDWPSVGISGGISSNLHPNQVTLAASLNTPFSRGPGHRGRIYLPSPALAVDTTTGLVSQSEANGVAATTWTLIQAINTAVLSKSMIVKIMSRKSGAAASHEVTGVSCGRVLDTQRRRRRSLKEHPA